MENARALKEAIEKTGKFDILSKDVSVPTGRILPEGRAHAHRFRDIGRACGGLGGSCRPTPCPQTRSTSQSSAWSSARTSAGTSRSGS